MKKFASFLELFAKQNPSSIAFEYEEDGKKMTCSYQGFLDKLPSVIIPKANRIGIFMDGSFECILFLFACVNNGKTVALLNPFESEEAIKRQIASAKLGEVVFGESSYEGLLCDEEANKEIIFFTSGTTSSSKGVVLDEARLCASAYNGGYHLPLNSGDRLLCLLPLSHVYGFVCSLLWGLEFGARVCLGRGSRHLLDDFSFYRPSVATLVPQMAAFLIKYNLLNPELRLILIGAGECEEAILNAIKAKGIRLSYGYGMTETSSGIALSLGEDPRAMSICPEFDIKIANDGEILVHAPSTLMKGYILDGEFSPAQTQNGYFATGDLGYIDENGLLYLKGRKKDILVLNDGTKIYCKEYEERLIKVLGPLDLAVYLDEKGRIALAIGKEKEERDLTPYIDSFNSDLPRNQQIVRVLHLNTPLPRTLTGKIKRYELNALSKGDNNVH